MMAQENLQPETGLSAASQKKLLLVLDQEMRMHDHLRLVRRGIRDFEKISIYKTLLADCNRLRNFIRELQRLIQNDHTIEPSAEDGFYHIPGKIRPVHLLELSSDHNALKFQIKDLQKELENGSNTKAVYEMLERMQKEHDAMALRMRQMSRELE